MSNPGSPQFSLEARDLSAVRGDRIIFEGLGFRVESGEVLQVEGRNGSGKTTLLRMICGLTRPTKGQMLWRGEDIQSLKADYWSELAYVGHLSGVKEELTPLENLDFAGRLSACHTDRDPLDVLERLGLPEEHEDIPCRKLSAGQRRRVALARLLLSGATLWVVDEPFTALDREGRAMVEELVAAHLDQGGMAVMTTHHTVKLGDHKVVELLIK